MLWALCGHPSLIGRMRLSGIWKGMYLTTDTEKARGQNTNTILGSIVDMKFLLGEGGDAM